MASGLFGSGGATVTGAASVTTATTESGSGGISVAGVAYWYGSVSLSGSGGATVAGAKFPNGYTYRLALTIPARTAGVTGYLASYIPSYSLTSCVVTTASGRSLPTDLRSDDTVCFLCDLSTIDNHFYFYWS